MLVDIAITIFTLTALYRGREIGFVRQLFSTIGFFGGLFIGALLEPHTVNLAHSQTARALVTLLTTLGCALLLLTAGEYLGLRIKYAVRMKRINHVDNYFGAILGAISLLFSVWLVAAIIGSLPVPSVQSALRNSRIISVLDKALPEAPTLIADLGHLIDPNGFPQVFIGNEPIPRNDPNIPSIGSLQPAVDKDRESVVKVEGEGCGGIVEGSGFVVGSGFVATNAHVVAGIAHPDVEDSNGTHSATVIWFDPNLDFAVLRVTNLAGKSLLISNSHISSNTPAAVLGYPGGGPFTASAALVLDEFTATGRNIYGQGSTNRDVYEIAADVIPGNSGGPLIAEDGTVIGVIFAESTTYQHVGYTLTTSQITSEINHAITRNDPVGTSNCAD